MGEVYSFAGIRAAKILNAVAAYREGVINLAGLRSFLAALEGQAANEAKSNTVRARTGARTPAAPVTREQTRRLAGESSARALRQLERAGLVTVRAGEVTITETLLGFAEGDDRRSAARLIPVPREMLRELGQEKRAAVVLAALVYMLRGLNFERGTGRVKNAGAVKATDIAALTGLSERAVRSARRELIERGWITRDEASTQVKLNRTGSYYTINTAWSRNGAASYPHAEQRRGQSEPRSAELVGNSPRDIAPEFAPRGDENRAESAPPIRRPESSLRELKNQKAGVCEEEGKGGEVPPDMRRIRLIDLRKPDRLNALYRDFLRAGKLEGGEASALNFAAAAVRAGRLDLPDERRVRVFLGIVSRRLWANITQNEEDRARQVITKRRETDPGFMRAA